MFLFFSSYLSFPFCICCLFTHTLFILENEKLKLEKIIVYPIKSCEGFEVNRWEIGSDGLRYDRGKKTESKPIISLSKRKIHDISSSCVMLLSLSSLIFRMVINRYDGDLCQSKKGIFLLY
jgi:hypothetical protein